MKYAGAISIALVMMGFVGIETGETLCVVPYAIGWVLGVGVVSNYLFKERKR